MLLRLLPCLPSCCSQDPQARLQDPCVSEQKLLEVLSFQDVQVPAIVLELGMYVLSGLDCDELLLTIQRSGIEDASHCPVERASSCQKPVRSHPRLVHA